MHSLKVLILLSLLLSVTTPSLAAEYPLSNLPAGMMSAEWGSSRKDRSVEGNPLKINNTTYHSGIGTHAASEMVIQRNSATSFRAMVGVDDETGGKGSVIFNVYGDNTLLWSSGIVKGGEPARKVSVNLHPHKEIRLEVTDAGDGISHDHANWADAYFLYHGIPPKAIRKPQPGDLPQIDAQVPTTRIELFNGKNTDNWIADIPTQGKVKSDIWSVKDGILYCTGKPAAHLITDTSWKDYRLEVEWAWPANGKGGNNGVLVHSSNLRTLYNTFPRSIEVQLQSGNAGDFWVIGEDITVDNMQERRTDRRIVKLKHGLEKPFGEWNTMIIHARNNTIRVWVNGELVNYGYNCTTSQGRISLQSEGAPCTFRRVSIMPLTDD